ncbi:MAG TPA: MtrB/PioB family decaheme-associated outer membrane protein [Syntrophales bacterium]|nr:MtrB/PioB family decaheme-associated outer membrane protein [Syntrophales bacterium]HOX93331.1 MtrB/PioB family decaheme-associated outer membrane protein [Syntrophales bacterium]HPI56532.1 MtrB/PioB family decaheme-associated outer membrane protein [Syntrophales bacterium]HPN25047.1 MtrB/PioB family decaheme-associated outer membrane protein [Syntrophales bacterium]HQM29210.1 MtrB/PioB family decaheme-associated outer membrane protein [Syntrophales bacterium]
MKSAIFIMVVMALILSPPCASAEDKKAEEGKAVTSDFSVTGQYTDIGGNRAKFNEYRDMREGVGVYVGAEAGSETHNSYLRGEAGNIGYRDQQYRLEGGQWGKFGVELFYDQIPHNLTEDARTFYVNPGSDNLTYPTQPPGTNVNTWSTFDYDVMRRKFGGGFKMDLLNPFFFNVSADRENRTGAYPFGVAGTTPGGISIELPAPIDYRTDGVTFQAGYSKNPLLMSLGYSYSTFNNDNNRVYFRNPANAATAAVTDVLTLPPDNTYQKLDFKGALKLPLRTKFNADLAVSQAKSDAGLLTSYVTTGGSTPVALSSPTFNGKVETQNYGLSLTSTPVPFMDGKIFYKYYERDNRSDRITTTDGATTLVNPLFGYKKNKAGAELGFRLPANFYLSGAYTYAHVHREREDIPGNDDDLYSVGLRWSGLSFMVARLGYERLNRKADFEGQNLGGAEPWIRRFDAASQNRDTFKATLDFFPLENLNFSLGYRYRHSDYEDTVLGFTDTKGNEFNFDVDYVIAKRVRLYGNFDYERTEESQFQRNINFTTPVYDPATSTSTNYNWTADQTNDSYGFTIGTDIYIVPKKWTLKLQHSYLKSNGEVDYTYMLDSATLAGLSPGGRTQDNVDISDWDDYSLRYYLVKITYQPTAALSCSIGYAYEKFVYGDAQYDGYVYVPATTGTNGAYLTGAYRDPSYEANVVFLNLTYKY